MAKLLFVRREHIVPGRRSPGHGNQGLSIAFVARSRRAEPARGLRSVDQRRAAGLAARGARRSPCRIAGSSGYNLGGTQLTKPKAPRATLAYLAITEPWVGLVSAVFRLQPRIPARRLVRPW